MNRFGDQFRKFIEFLLPWLVLAILLTYTYAKFFEHPYGFSWDTDGKVDRLFLRPSKPTLHLGDQLVQVGPLTWNAFHADLRKTFFEGVNPGETVPIIVERNGQPLTVLWTLPGFNRGEVQDQLFSEWPLAFIFWLVGLLTVTFLRPKDDRWVLLSAFNFLTAIWLGSGGGTSNFHIWYSALVLRVTIWLCVPVYLHMHWVYPRPLGKLPAPLIWSVYTVTIGIMIAQWFQIFSSNLYFLGFLLAVLGSIVLLIAHALRQAEARNDLRLLLIAVAFALLPLLGISAVAFLDVSSRVSSLALLSLPVIPLTYLYAAYRRQLGGFEMRANRFISIYLFVIMLGTVALPLIALADRLITSSDKAVVIGTTASLFTAAAFVWAFPRFQSFVERNWLGIATPPEQIQEAYSKYTTTSTSVNALTDLLKEVMLPSLLVRQFLFVQFEAGSPRVLMVFGLDEKQRMGDSDLNRLLSLKDIALPDLQKNRPYPWVRMILPLKVGEEVLGLWLFGKRDPDDFYSQHELPMLQSLADQTAIALSNIIQTERLHAAYQDNIKRTEEGRQRIALELHDGILNNMAALMMKLDDQNLTPEFQKSYGELTTQLRELIKDLRPAMLTYGIQPAIEGYADTLLDRADGKVKVVVDLQSDDSRYPIEVEQHLFRIVQEACTNALRHANPTRISITGKLGADLIEIQIKDDGAGFNRNEKLDLNTLQSNNHFGLTGMFERAELIGANINIESTPGKGTRVELNWRPRTS